MAERHFTVPTPCVVTVTLY